MAVFKDLPSEIVTRIIGLAVPAEVRFTLRLLPRKARLYEEPILNPVIPLQLVCSRSNDITKIIGKPVCVLTFVCVSYRDLNIWLTLTSPEHRALFHRFELRRQVSGAKDPERLLKDRKYRDEQARFLDWYYGSELRKGYEDVELLWMETKSAMSSEGSDTWEDADWKLGGPKPYSNAGG